MNNNMQLTDKQLKMICAVTLPLPPGINATYKTGNGNFYCSDEAGSFQQLAHITLNQQLKTLDLAIISEIKRAKSKVPLALDLRFYYKTLWKKDIDGGIKAVQDVLFKHIDLNDNQVVRLHVSKYADRNNPRVEIELYFAGESW